MVAGLAITAGDELILYGKENRIISPMKISRREFSLINDAVLEFADDYDIVRRVRCDDLNALKRDLRARGGIVKVYRIPCWTKVQSRIWLLHEYWVCCRNCRASFQSNINEPFHADKNKNRFSCNKNKTMPFYFWITVPVLWLLGVVSKMMNDFFFSSQLDSVSRCRPHCWRAFFHFDLAGHSAEVAPALERFSCDAISIK